MSLWSLSRSDQCLSRVLAQPSKNQGSTVHPRKPVPPSCGRQILSVVRSARVSTPATSAELGTYRAVVLSIRSEGRQQVPRVVCDPTLRHYTSPVGHICVVSKCKDAGSRKHGWEKGFGPWLGRALGSPRLIAIAGQAVDKDDAEQQTLADIYQSWRVRTRWRRRPLGSRAV